jgi:hypothetical protein
MIILQAPQRMRKGNLLNKQPWFYGMSSIPHILTLSQKAEFPDVLAVQTRSKAPIVQNHPVIAQAPKKYVKPSSLAQQPHHSILDPISWLVK